MSSRERKALEALMAAVAPLVDPDGVVQPFSTAWAFDLNDVSFDGEALHAALTEAYRAAVKAREPRPGEVQVTFTAVTQPPPEVRFMPVPWAPGYGPLST